MSIPAAPPNEAIAAALAPGMTLQDVAIRLAQGVCQAYAAYNNGSNLAPTLPGYHAFNQIWVYEFDPNVNPFSVPQAQARAASAVAAKTKGVPGSSVSRSPTHVAPTVHRLRALVRHRSVRRRRVTSSSGSPQPPTTTRTTFSRCAERSRRKRPDTICSGWGDNTACNLPSQNWPWDQQSYGQVNSYLYGLYADTDGDTVTSLAKSCLTAIQTTSAQAPNLPWYMGAHSLGGAMLSLAALDAVVSKVLSSTTPLVMTFGSLHVGDHPLPAPIRPLVPASVRVANLCDFVPSMVSLEPVTPTDPYVHVGTEATFVWQTWDDWGNHSLANIYLPMVQNYWNMIQWGQRNYPQ